MTDEVIVAELFSAPAGMKWQEVQSSQITHVGYDAEREVLGLRFPASKKSPASEYHYSMVDDDTYQALMTAESIGSYFGKHIKPFPLKYPYTKVETENPPQPPSSPNGGGAPLSTRTSTRTTSPSIPTIEGDELPSPGTALAKVDDLKPEFVFVPGNMDGLLMEIREQALAEVAGLNISTPKQREQFKKTAMKVVKSRTYIEKMRVGYVAAEKKRLATIDQVARNIKEILEGIEEEVRRPLTAWENKEKERIRLHNEALEEVRQAGPYTAANWLNLPIEAMRERLKEIESDPRDWQEFAVPAEQAKKESCRLIADAIAQRNNHDAGQAELAELRRAAAERAEADKQEAVARNAREQAERQAAVEIQRAKDAEAAAEQARIAAEKRAEDAAAQALRDQEAAVEAERQRAAAAAKAEQEANEARARDEAHRKDVHERIVEALVSLALIDRPAAHTVVACISDGSIPHVTIKY